MIKNRKQNKEELKSCFLIIFRFYFEKFNNDKITFEKRTNLTKNDIELIDRSPFLIKNDMKLIN